MKNISKIEKYSLLWSSAILPIILLVTFLMSPPAYSSQLPNHIQIAYLAMNDARTPEIIRQLLRRNIKYYKNGSAGPDALNMVGKFSGLAVKAHYETTGKLAKTMLRLAALETDPVRREQYLTYTLGWITHAYLDVYEHAVVNQYGGYFDINPHWHKELELFESTHVMATANIPIKLFETSGSALPASLVFNAFNITYPFALDLGFKLRDLYAAAIIMQGFSGNMVKEYRAQQRSSTVDASAYRITPGEIPLCLEYANMLSPLIIAINHIAPPAANESESSEIQVQFDYIVHDDGLKVSYISDWYASNKKALDAISVRFRYMANFLTLKDGRVIIAADIDPAVPNYNWDTGRLESTGESHAIKLSEDFKRIEKLELHWEIYAGEQQIDEGTESIFLPQLGSVDSLTIAIPTKKSFYSEQASKQLRMKATLRISNNNKHFKNMSGPYATAFNFNLDEDTCKTHLSSEKKVPIEDSVEKTFWMPKRNPVQSAEQAADSGQLPRLISKLNKILDELQIKDITQASLENKMNKHTWKLYRHLSGFPADATDEFDDPSVAESRYQDATRIIQRYLDLYKKVLKARKHAEDKFAMDHPIDNGLRLLTDTGFLAGNPDIDQSTYGRWRDLPNKKAHEVSSALLSIKRGHVAGAKLDADDQSFDTRTLNDVVFHEVWMTMWTQIESLGPAAHGALVSSTELEEAAFQFDEQTLVIERNKYHKFKRDLLIDRFKEHYRKINPTPPVLKLVEIETDLEENTQLNGPGWVRRYSTHASVVDDWGCCVDGEVEVIQSFRVTSAPLQIRPTKPFTITIELAERRQYPDDHICRGGNNVETVPFIGILASSQQISARNEGRISLSASCDETGAEKACGISTCFYFKGATTKADRVSLSLRFIPVERKTDGQGEQVFYYDASITGGPKTTLTANRVEPFYSFNLPTDKQGYLPADFDTTALSDSSGITISVGSSGIGSAGLSLHYLPVRPGDLALTSLTIPEVPAEFSEPLKEGQLSFGNVVPNLVGKTRAEAKRILKVAGFKEENTEYGPGGLARSAEESGIVIKQSPPGKTRIRAEKKVTLFIRSVYLVRKIVPLVEGKKLEKAIEILKQAGLVAYPKIKEPAKSPQQALTVISQEPAFGREVKDGEKVELMIYGTYSPLTVPNLAGEKLSEARRILTDLGLKLKPVIKQPATSVEEALMVVDQLPLPGDKIEPGGTVNVSIYGEYREKTRQEAVAAKDCTAFQHARAFWDASRNRAGCQCQPGYQSAAEMCRPTRETMIANTRCGANSVARWSDQFNQPRCFCQQGFSWNRNRSDCVASRETLVKNTDCSSYGNSHAAWDNNRQGPACYCNNGFDWNRNRSDCVASRDTLVKNTDCSSYDNSHAAWDNNRQGPACYCNNGFDWNRGQTACVQIASNRPEQDPMCESTRQTLANTPPDHHMYNIIREMYRGMNCKDSGNTQVESGNGRTTSGSGACNWVESVGYQVYGQSVGGGLECTCELVNRLCGGKPRPD